MNLAKRLLAYVVAVLILVSCLSGIAPRFLDEAYAAPGNIENIKYYGDKTKCKMPKEMALAYVEAIESQIPMVEGNSGTQFDLYAALLDLSGDGMPILVTLVAERIGKSVFYMDGAPAIFVWTWDGKKAEKYDFNKDLKIKDLSQISFTTSPGDGGVYVYEGASFADASSYGYLRYKVSNAQLSLEYHETLHIATVSIEDNDYAHSESLPGVDSKVYDGDIRFAKVSDLLDAGWIMGEYNHQVERKPLYILEVNDKLEPFDSPDSFEKWFQDGFSMSGEVILLDEKNTAEHIIKENSMSSCYTVAEELRKYAEFAGKPVYPYDDVYGSFSDSEAEDIAKKVAEKYDGEVGEIYKLSADLYYVIIYLDGKVTGTVVAKNTNGGKGWRIVKSSDKFLDQEELEKEVSKDNRTSNIKLDFGKLDEGIDHIEKSLKNFDGTCLNAAGEADLASFIDASILKACTANIKAKNNSVIISGSDVRKLSGEAVKMNNEYAKLLEKNGIIISKPITVVFQFVVKNVDCKKPVYVQLTKEILESMGDADEMKLVLGDSARCIKVSKLSLQSIINAHGEIIVVICDNGNGSYTIQFTDAKGNIIEKLDAPVSFAVPAANEFCTIQAEYTGGTDNWGGQYDGVNKALIFDAFYSGTYTVLDKKTEIDDIDDLSEEEQRIIRFMVSKGFFEVDGKLFNPNESLTRYEFSKALVKMCFEADYGAKASFSDLKEDNPYYPYVASGATKGIIEGYDDGTFRGENNALREEVIALCSRTLAERKGYSEPSDPDLYLNFTDKEDIDWGHSEIALAVRQSIIDAGGMLYPQEAISRADAALILYRLFMLLYEVEPVAVNVSSPVSNTTIPWAIAGGAAVIGGAAVLVLLKRKRLAKND